MKKVWVAIAVMLLAGGTFFGANTYAQTDPQIIRLPNPLGSTSTPLQLLDIILNFLIKIGGVIASIMIVIGAFQILFAAGNPEKFITGRRTIVYTAIAYGILFMAKGIVLVIKDFLT